MNRIETIRWMRQGILFKRGEFLAALNMCETWPYYHEARLLFALLGAFLRCFALNDGLNFTVLN